MTLLKIPEKYRDIKFSESGESFKLDITNIPALREMAKLSESALKASRGIAWTQDEEALVISDSIRAINVTLGEGAYERAVAEVPDMKDNAVLLVGICGQLHNTVRGAIDEYVGQYRPQDQQIAELKEMLGVISQAAPTLRVLNDSK